jgi:hypothetical protein
LLTSELQWLFSIFILLKFSENYEFLTLLVTFSFVKRNRAAIRLFISINSKDNR